MTKTEIKICRQKHHWDRVLQAEQNNADLFQYFCFKKNMYCIVYILGTFVAIPVAPGRAYFGPGLL